MFSAVSAKQVTSLKIRSHLSSTQGRAIVNYAWCMNNVSSSRRCSGANNTVGHLGYGLLQSCVQLSTLLVTSQNPNFDVCFGKLLDRVWYSVL